MSFHRERRGANGIHSVGSFLFTEKKNVLFYRCGCPILVVVSLPRGSAIFSSILRKKK